MRINKIWFDFRYGIFNYLVVINTYGYLGDCHIAVNYACLHPSLMPYLRDIVSFQALRRGIKLKGGVSITNSKEISI